MCKITDEISTFQHENGKKWLHIITGVEESEMFKQINPNFS
jgi:hypothetical protein